MLILAQALGWLRLSDSQIAQSLQAVQLLAISRCSEGADINLQGRSKHEKHSYGVTIFTIESLSKLFC